MSHSGPGRPGITGNVTLGLAMIGGGLALGGGAIGAAVGDGLAGDPRSSRASPVSPRPQAA